MMSVHLSRTEGVEGIVEIRFGSPYVLMTIAGSQSCRILDQISRRLIVSKYTKTVYPIQAFFRL